MNSNTSHLIGGAQSPTWTVELVTDCDVAVLSEAQRLNAQLDAIEFRVVLTFQNNRCTATFSIQANNMMLASRSALARWAHVTEVAALPWWEAISMTVKAVPPPVVAATGLSDADPQGPLLVAVRELPRHVARLSLVH
jgi:hypothetical protein